MNNNDYIRVRLNTELKEKIKEAAKKDGRSMSNFVIQTLKEKIEKDAK